MIIESLHQIASNDPDRIALEGTEERLTYGELDIAVAEAAHELNALELRTLGLLANNGLPWALADLAALAANVPLVPVPLFFSPNQILHVMGDAGMDALLTDQPKQIESLLQSADIRFHRVGELCGLHLIRLHGVGIKTLPQGTVKITYTSGTTGEPKGVCLSLTQIETVAASLRDASEAQAGDRHLSLTPLSTLLENVGGIYVPLLAGASTCLLPLQEVGLNGASGLDIGRMLLAMSERQASSAILAPQMLQAMVAAADAGKAIPQYLRFVAVGGAPVAPRLLERAHKHGIPVFEGYGLSECASVVALNTSAHCCLGSVGKPLPHVSVSFSADGEILVSGSTFLGYLGQQPPAQPWPTGDIGYMDHEGFLHVTGRKKSLFITSFGRNVAPEWVERELTQHPAIAQAAVFGEAKPFNVAVIVIRQGFSTLHANTAVQLANQALPDYARIHSWIIAETPFTSINQQMTANGRLKREAILANYADALESLYQEETDVVF